MTTEIRPPAAHQRPSGRLYLGAHQYNLVDGADAIVNLDTISAGFTDGIEDVVNHKITPGAAGFYSIMGQVTFWNVVAARNYRVFIFISGLVNAVYNFAWAGGGTWFSVPVACLVKLTATDYVHLRARSDSGDNTVDIYGAEHLTFLSVQRVR